MEANISAIEDDEKRAQDLDDVLPEAFAIVKNACRRLMGKEIEVRGQKLIWDLVPFDVQLIVVSPFIGV
jgi:preprotein translocase subunit SecA